VAVAFIAKRIFLRLAASIPSFFRGRQSRRSSAHGCKRASALLLSVPAASGASASAVAMPGPHKAAIGVA
jgi:hypothetical protein